METINFYRTKDTYGDFSNFASFPIEIEGVRWPTSEHYFQGQKFVGLPFVEAIRNEISPMKAVQMARQQPGLRVDWDVVKEDVTRTALFAKFTQHR